MTDPRDPRSPDKDDDRSWIWFLVSCSLLITAGLVTG